MMLLMVVMIMMMVMMVVVVVVKSRPLYINLPVHLTIPRGPSIGHLMLFWQGGSDRLGRRHTQGRLLHINDGANAPWKK